MKQRLEASKMASNDSVTDLQSRIFPAMTVSCRQSKDSDDVYKVQEYPNGRLNWLSLFSCNYLGTVSILFKNRFGKQATHQQSAEDSARMYDQAVTRVTI